MVILPENCLTACCVGLDFVRPKFRLSHYYDEILDSIYDIEDINTQFKFEKHNLTVLLPEIKFQFTPKKIVIFSNISIRDILGQAIFGDSNFPEDLCHIWSDALSDMELLTQSKEQHIKFKNNFLPNAASIIDLIDKVANDDIPNLRFIGYVEFYLIPIQTVKWVILNEFDRMASIHGQKMTEKAVRNRYRYREVVSDNVDQQSLIFNINIPENDRERANYAGTSFDLQWWAQENKKLNDFGKTVDVIKFLRKDLSSKIEKAKLLNFDTIGSE